MALTLLSESENVPKERCKVKKLFLFSLICLIAIAGCDEPPPADGDGDVDSDTDIDGDSDVDGDTDTDTDTDVDADSDSDADADSDADSDADGDADSDSDAEEEIPTGCTSESDRSALAGGLESFGPILGCTLECDTDPSCMESCLETLEWDLTETCTTCTVDMLVCGGENCTDDCLTGDIDRCERCMCDNPDTSCMAEFLDCSGVALSDCVCERDCTDRECGGDGCGGSCGTCDPDHEECIDGLCVCQPQCEARTCGDDACGGQCGFCLGTQECIAGNCAETCTDEDSDGFPGTGAGCDPTDPEYDCNDSRASVNPGATEVCGNGFDDDCHDGDLPCCTTHASRQCLDDGDIYWFNSCGAREERYLNCGSLGCVTNCSGGTPGCITSWRSPECRSGNVWVGDFGDFSCQTSTFPLSHTVSGPRMVQDCHGRGCSTTTFTCGCTPDCGTDECGGDGCGGSCGTCGAGRTCEDGECVVEDPCGGPCPAHSFCDPSISECVCDVGYVPDPTFTSCIGLGGSCGAVGVNGYCTSTDQWVWCDIDASGSGALRAMSCSGAVGSFCQTFPDEGFGSCDCGDFGDGTLCTDLTIGSAYEYRLTCVGGGYNVLAVDNCQGITGRSSGFCSTHVTGFGFESACYCDECSLYFPAHGCGSLCDTCEYNSDGNFHMCVDPW